MEDLLSFPVGKCKVCGCTHEKACYHPDYGSCWWVDDTETLCSHCADASHENSLKALIELEEVKEE